MELGRKVIRGTLLLAGALAVSVAVVALREQGGLSPQAWATVAAVLAVIAALTSAWTGQRVLELQEDALRPCLQAIIDARSRYQLVQFRVVNKGQSPAYDIQLEWNRPLKNTGGKVITLGPEGSIPVLGPGEAVSVLLGAAHDFFQKYEDTTCSGTISFSNASGDRATDQFTISAEHERSALLHDEEEPKTHYELQKIPDELKRISREISRLGQLLRRAENQPIQAAAEPAAAADGLEEGPEGCG